MKSHDGLHNALQRLHLAITGEKKRLTDHTIKSAVDKWFDPEKKQAVVEEFGEIGNWDVSNVTNMDELFAAESGFNEDLSGWDTSKVTDMSGMFIGASSFNQPVEAWDTSQVTDMSYMFQDAYSFDQPVEAWDTSKVTDMTYMFEGASSFKEFPNWLDFRADPYQCFEASLGWQ